MSANYTPEKEDLKILTPFKMQVLTNFPYIEADFDALTNYQLLCKIVEYLNEVIAETNEVTEQTLSLYNAYVALQNYVNEEIEEFEETVNGTVQDLEDYMNNYFDNLDVQEEINNKLDEMANDGSLSSLINTYIDPIIQEQNENMATFRNNINEEIEELNTKVEAATSGSPLVASSTADMTETDRVYVNTTDGKWYYYDGDSWEIGGTYQAAEDSEALTELETRFDDFVDFKTENLLDYTTFTTGYLNGPTPFPAFTTMEYTDYIPITNNYYKFEGGSASTTNVINQFDSNKDYLNSITYTNLDAADGIVDYRSSEVKYIRVNFLKENVNNGTAKVAICDSEGNILTTDAIKYANSLKSTLEYTNTSYWKNKKANFLGDSITYGAYTPIGGSSPSEVAEKPFCKIASDILGITTYRNYGISGTSISGTSSILSAYAFVNRYNNMDNDADLIVVCGGTNDYATNVQLGTIADTTDISFYGALNVLCNGLQSKYLGKKIVFVTPIHRVNEGANTAGYTLEQYSKAIFDVARDKYGFAVINGFEMGLSCKNSDMRATYIVDGLHPNPIGHEVYGKSLAKHLNSI